MKFIVSSVAVLAMAASLTCATSASAARSVNERIVVKCRYNVPATATHPKWKWACDVKYTILEGVAQRKPTKVVFSSADIAKDRFHFDQHKGTAFTDVSLVRHNSGGQVTRSNRLHVVDLYKNGHRLKKLVVTGTVVTHQIG